jgi:esterase/lipase superfamily enzyme
MIPSQIMGRHMHMWRFGHYGAPLLAFPSASGMAHEWQAHGMVDALSDLIDRGKLKLYCTESNVAEAWTNRDADPAWRVQRHMAFERYIVDELVPLIRNDCNSTEIPVAACGTSLGAYYSANFSLKYPEIFRFALCLSGRYDISWLTGGYVNQDIYFNNPISYLPGLDGDELARVRAHAHLVLVCGQGKWEDGNIEDTHRLADALTAKGISHERDLWGPDVSHEWEWWRRQAALHLGRAYG